MGPPGHPKVTVIPNRHPHAHGGGRACFGRNGDTRRMARFGGTMLSIAQSIRRELLGESPQMERVRHLIARAADVDAPVLITGETGTGKSLTARLIHAHGARRGAPLVPVNCAGIPDGLFESEFFGHRRGAFTGAVESRRGLFEVADGGTLFLDEIGELPQSQQAKLLTVLEDRQVRRVGDETIRSLDVRVVAATSRNLSEAVPAGRFRADLFHRLAVLRIALAPLRERPGDIPVLAHMLLRGLIERYGVRTRELPVKVQEVLMEYRWPGNVRELAHVLEAAAICNPRKRISASGVEEVIRSQPGRRDGTDVR